MFQSKAEIETFFKEFNSATYPHEAWLAPQTIYFDFTKNLAPLNVLIGTQNCAEKLSGAFTGEISAAAIKEMNGGFVILGHSERRQYFQETNQSLNTKIKTALSQKLKVIYCVGETLQEREANETLSIIKNQLSLGLRDLGTQDMSELLVAYEPVWAIGTGKTATPDQAQEVHAFIRQELAGILGADSNKVKLLYGGSVKPDNVVSLLGKNDIDGALVGGASLKAKDFLALCQAKV